MKKNKIKILLLVLIAPCFLSMHTWAQEGIPDVTFGAAGIVTTPVGNLNDIAYSELIQPDGKIVLGGWSNNGTNSDFALVRYTNDGSLDNTFGAAGKVTTDLGNSGDAAYSIALQPDGKIVAAGISLDTGINANSDFALVRYMPDGSIDTTFGTNGKVITDIDSSDDYAQSVVVQTDGKIIVTGYSVLNFVTSYSLARYTTNGSIDSTFGTGGKIVGSNGTSIFSVVIQPDGKIILAGSGTSGNTSYFSLIRFKTNGSIDSTFGNWGNVITNIGNSGAQAHSIVLQADGKIVVAGLTTYVSSNANFALARYNPNGSIDNLFGNGGTVTTDFGNSNDLGYSIALQSDGKIVVAGYIDNGGLNSDVGLVRYYSNGNLDNSFGSGGMVTSSTASNNDGGYAVAIQADGKILVAGFLASNSNYDFLLRRYTGTLTGLAELNNTNFKMEISPNPFNQQTTITFNQEQKNTTLQITDMLGKKIKTLNFSGTQLTIQKEEMPAGIYFVQATDEAKNITTKKMSVQ